jgi:hypothetical protein
MLDIFSMIFLSSGFQLCKIIITRRIIVSHWVVLWAFGLVWHCPASAVWVSSNYSFLQPWFCILQFKTKGGSQLKEYCTNLTKEDCRRQSGSFVSCAKVNVITLILPDLFPNLHGGQLPSEFTLVLLREYLSGICNAILPYISEVPICRMH